MPCSEWTRPAHGSTVQFKWSERMQFKREADQKAEGGHHGLGRFSGAGQPVHRVGESGRLVIC